MSGDLPDWNSSMVGVAIIATKIQHGLDSNKSPTPDVGDCYNADDTQIEYRCFTLNVWTALQKKVSYSSPTRLLDTVYQNTSSKIIVVLASLQLVLQKTGTTLSGSAEGFAKIGASNPPSNTVTQASLILSLGLSSAANTLAPITELCFIVPPDYYYIVTTSLTGDGSSVNKISWVEYLLH